MTFFRPYGVITFEAALRDLGSKDAKVRESAATALGDLEDDETREAAIDGLITATSDQVSRVRSAACLSLAELGGERAIEAVILCLDDGSPDVRQAAAIGLGQAGDERGFAPLAEALTSGPADLRFQAATSLVEIDADRSYEPLTAALAGEEDGEVLGAIALGLGAIGDRRAAELIARLLEDRRRVTRFDAAYALADLGDQRAGAVLGPFTSDKELGWSAAEALEKLGDAAAVPALANALSARGTPREIVLRAAAAILALDPACEAAEEARDALLRGLKARKIEQRGLAVELLGRVGGTWAEDPLLLLGASRRGRLLEEEIQAAIAALDRS